MIFFDLDGPILDVSGRYYAIYSELLKSAGFQPIPLDEYWNKKRNRVPELQILAESGASNFYTDYAKERKLRIEAPNYLRFDQLQSRTNETLIALKKRALHIVTLRSNRANLEQQLGELGLLEYFQAVLSAPKQGEGWQVKCRLIREFCGDVTPGSTIFGDTETDLMAGKELGFKTIAVLSGIRSRELLLRSEPDAILEGIWELDKIEEVLRK